ncbi:MAG: gas vesicle protein, partial [Candidatus Omnitrophica bacterium]|nr:gas vesicle protein [Candidatus Omnitrophota bacterium]
MEPIRDAQVTLVDLLDRVLDKGLVINADIIISVAGIPLIGVNLRAALAGMETMLKYGVMKAWDEKIRVWEGNNRTTKEISLLQGEELKLKMLGSFFYAQGIYVSWRHGQIYLTDKRLFLWHQEFNEVIFQTSLSGIRGLIVQEDILYLILEDEKRVRLRSVEIQKLAESIKETVRSSGFIIDENPVFPKYEEGELDFLIEGETITHRGKAWHMLLTDGVWKPGHLYITNKRLCWWYDFEKILAFEIPTEKILGAAVEVKNLSKALKKKRVFDVIYNGSSERKVASFSGEGMYEWERALTRIISFRERIEACPQCGNKANVLELLEKGCTNC